DGECEVVCERKGEQELLATLGHGALTEPTAGARPWPWERVLMPHLRHSPTAARPSQIKSAFRMSRSAAAGSHAAGTPGYAPGGCAGRCMPGQSARQYEGQGPMDCAAFTGTPGGMPMAFVRCYTGTDGQSHFEDQDLLPPDMERSIEQAASSITFT